MDRKVMTRMLIVLTLLPVAGRADEPSRPLHVGVLGELGLSRMSITPLPLDVAVGSATRAGAGLTLDLRMSRALSLELRALFAHRGTAFTVGDRRATLESRYLALPLLLKARAGRGPLQPYLALGPEIAFKTTARIRAVEAGITAERDAGDQLKDMAFGLDFGAGVERRWGRATTFAEATYALGLSNVAAGTSDGERARTRNLTFGAGVRF